MLVPPEPAIRFSRTADFGGSGCILIPGVPALTQSDGQAGGPLHIFLVSPILLRVRRSALSASSIRFTRFVAASIDDGRNRSSSADNARSLELAQVVAAKAVLPWEINTPPMPPTTRVRRVGCILDIDLVMVELPNEMPRSIVDDYLGGTGFM